MWRIGILIRGRSVSGGWRRGICGFRRGIFRGKIALIINYKHKQILSSTTANTVCDFSASFRKMVKYDNEQFSLSSLRRKSKNALIWFQTFGKFFGECGEEFTEEHEVRIWECVNRRATQATLILTTNTPSPPGNNLRKTYKRNFGL